MDKLSFQEVAIKKNLPLVGEDGYVLHEQKASLSGLKGKTKKDLKPTEEDMALINLCRPVMADDTDEYWVFRGCNPLGLAGETDIQGDSFEKSAELDLIAKAFNTPILIDHDHSLSNQLPFGFCIRAYDTPEGMREDWAIPIEDYNKDLRRAAINGSVNKISVGTLVAPQDKICNICDKSIYSYSCPHEANQVDASGQRATVRIRRVYRYLERSLVNAPARERATTLTMRNKSAWTYDNLDPLEVEDPVKDPKDKNLDPSGISYEETNPPISDEEISSNPPDSIATPIKASIEPPLDKIPPDAGDQYTPPQDPQYDDTKPPPIVGMPYSFNLFLPEFAKNDMELSCIKSLIKNPDLYKGLPVMQSRLDQLLPTQSVLDAKRVQQFVQDKNFDGGLVINRDQKLYMIDGHHRMEAAKRSGHPTIWAHTLSLPQEELKTHRDFSSLLNVNHYKFEESLKTLPLGLMLKEIFRQIFA